MGSGSPRPAAWCWSRWTFESRVLHDARLKGGLSTTHPLRGDEIGANKAWLVERTRIKAPGRTFFLSEQRKPLPRSPPTSPCANTARRPSYRWPFIPTCCDMPAALLLPTRAQTFASSRSILSSAGFSTSCATPPLARHGSRGCGGSVCNHLSASRRRRRGHLEAGAYVKGNIMLHLQPQLSSF